MPKRKVARRTVGVQKVRTGIEGFDEITSGGLPRGRQTLVMGGAGSGKTVFALQVLVNGARLLGEPGIFVAFEENARQILINSASFDWSFADLTTRGGRTPLLALIDGQLSLDAVQSGTFDLAGLLVIIEHRVKQSGAKRIVFDGIDVLLGLLTDQHAQRREMHRIHDLLERLNLTGIMTLSTATPDQMLPFMQSMADCLILLEHRMRDRTSSRSLRVVKYRGSAFVANEFPLAISSTGVEMANFSAGGERTISHVRISSGIPALDQMLGGGYFRGSAILIAGSPGTAKTTLAGAFVAAACARGERALFIALDEHPGEIVRDLTSVNVHLARYVKSGLLKMEGDKPQNTSAEDQFVRVRRWIREHRPSVLVIDPVSSVMQMGGTTSAVGVAQRFLELVKSENITMYWTSVYERGDDPVKSTSLPVSTVADTWIHLTYQAGRGERNRTLTILKSRGTAHSNQVRELVLSSDGITLADVSTAGGEVLLGTARWEQEAATAAAERQTVHAQSEKRRMLEAEAAAAREQRRVFEKQLERIALDLRELDREAMKTGEDKTRYARELKTRRGGKAPPALKKAPRPRKGGRGK